jgi:ElaB/YqjD/DUF883 family membrane-anchored ribosome-binding protein
MIRTEIEQTRSEMAETVDAIQEKLRPRKMAARAAERVKAATTERVRAMADTATHSAEHLMNRTREATGGWMDSIRDNPFPMALIGLGLAWWVADSRRMTRSRSSNWADRERWDGEGTSQSLRQTTREYVDDAKEYVNESSQAVRRSTRRVQHQFTHMLHDNPLLVGAGALMLGAAFGMSVPETDRENEWMGETRDSVVERAQQLATDAAAKAQQTAGEVVAGVVGQAVDSVVQSPKA